MNDCNSHYGEGWAFSGFACRKSPSGRVEFSGRARHDVEPEASRDGFTASAELHPTRWGQIEATSDRSSNMALIPHRTRIPA